MIGEVYKRVEAEASGEIALGHVAEITRHHRIQASPGIREACRYAVEALKGFGLGAELRVYPASGVEYDWSSLRFLEWQCRDAWLRMVEPREGYLARFQEQKMSVVQRSVSTGGVVRAELVAAGGKGEEAEDYEGLDVAGKLVLVCGDIHRAHQLAVVERGALGLVFDGMFVRPPNLLEGELDDALKYTSFWWTPGDKPGYGWVITPRAGREIRRMLEKGETVKVEGLVDAELAPGSLENAVASIEGAAEGEVVLVGHICHPQPSANDNASGAAAVLEAARVLAKLIGEGRLEKPRRRITFTLVPEMTGTYSYLAEREGELGSMVAALNLDMVGEDQCKTGSVLTIHRTPDSLPSFVNHVAEAVFEEAQKELASFGGEPTTPSFRVKVEEFSAGSDHYIYSDPTVGVPCPMLIQWPDKFYHTSHDTLDKVSPHMLRKAAAIAATYAYTLANLGEEDAPWLAAQVYTREVERLARLTRQLSQLKEENPARAVERLLHKGETAKKALNSITKVAPNSTPIIEPYLEAIDREVKHLTETLERALGKPREEEASNDEGEASELVPVRIHRGPPSLRPWVSRLGPEDREAYWRFTKEHESSRGLETLALYWADGERSIAEISKQVYLERGKTDLDYLKGFFGFLEKMGLIQLKRNKA